MAHRSDEDRNFSIRWAREVLSKPEKWVIWDTETTGWGGNDEIIQLGLLRADGRVLFNSLIRTVRNTPIHPEAFAKHRISKKMLIGQPTFPEIVPKVIRAIKRKHLIAYNAAYEKRILQQTTGRSGGPALPLYWDCAMEQYARFVGEWFRGKYKWQKLPAVEHAAIGDCRAALKLIKKMAKALLTKVPRPRPRF